MKPSRLLILLPLLLVFPGFLDTLSVQAQVVECFSLGGWSTTVMPVAPAHHHEGALAILDGNMYLIAGFYGSGVPYNRVDVYDSTTNLWTPDPARPADLPDPIGISHIVGIADPVNNEIWVAGGYRGPDPGVAVDNVWRYSVATDTWTAGPPLPGPRASGAMVRVGRNVHYFGGLIDRTTVSNAHWVLDLDNVAAGWQPLAPMIDGRAHMNATLLNGRLYTIGGQYNHDFNLALGWPSAQDLPAVDVYDIATDTWTTLANLPSPRSHAETSIFTVDDRVMVIGGRDNSGGLLEFLSSVVTYDPLTDTWTEQRPLPVPRLGHVGAYLNGRIYVIAGADDVFSPVSTSFVSRVITDCTPTPAPAQPVVNEPPPNIGLYDPAISKLGFLLPGELGITGEQIEWVVTVRNTGTAGGSNITITDTLRPELRIDRVDSPTGTVAINGQTVTLTLNSLAPGDSVQFSIFTTVLNNPADGIIDNTACVNGGGVQEECATAPLITRLPQTGESPLWRARLLNSLWLLVGIGLIFGMIGIRRRHLRA